MTTVTLTIDGIQVTVPKGTTVLEAAESVGIFIPTFCHDPELSKPGACRICVVEIPGARNLPAACVTEPRKVWLSILLPRLLLKRAKRT